MRQASRHLVWTRRLGIDLVGEVAGTGTGVTDLTEGDPVWGVSENPIGTNAEYFALSRDRVSRPPANLSPIEAVTLIAGGTTAITALRDRAHLRAGERLLVRGPQVGWAASASRSASSTRPT